MSCWIVAYRHPVARREKINRWLPAFLHGSELVVATFTLLTSLFGQHHRKFDEPIMRFGDENHDVHGSYVVDMNYELGELYGTLRFGGDFRTDWPIDVCWNETTHDFSRKHECGVVHHDAHGQMDVEQIGENFISSFRALEHDLRWIGTTDDMAGNAGIRDPVAMEWIGTTF